MKKRVIVIIIGVVLFFIAGIGYVFTKSDKEVEKENQSYSIELEPVTKLSNDANSSFAMEQSIDKDSFITIEEMNDTNQQSNEEKEMHINQEEVIEKGQEVASFYVYVCGAVHVPGVYLLPEGSRVVQAIESAGGFTKEAQSDFLNQARKVIDGEKIYVPTKKEVEDLNITSDVINATMKEEMAMESFVGNPTSIKESKNSSLIDINKATKEELMTLTGIGEAKAESILRYREQQGTFQTKEQLMEIDGIKEAVYNKIMDDIYVTKEN